MANWDWGSGSSGGYSQRNFQGQPSGGQEFYGTHYYAQQPRQNFVPYNSSAPPPPPGFGGGSSSYYDYNGVNGYQGYQYQDNYVPTMVYSSSNAPNSQWYGDYNAGNSGSYGEEAKEGANANYFNFTPSTSNYTSRGRGGGRSKFKFSKNHKQQQQNSQESSNPRRDNWEAKPFLRSKKESGDSKAEEEADSKKTQKKLAWRNGDKNWRSRRDNSTVCQRERLIEQLLRGTLECLVCCERVRHQDSVWSCSNCHHILHLKCTVKWAASSKDDNGWRCPACQNITKTIPTTYTCLCGKVDDPQFVRGETPHCCGQICGRKKDCPHGCTILCHPGPCPQCCANIKRLCGCGRTDRMVLCSSTVTIECDSVCGKPLNCGVHLCAQICHQGDCNKCDRKIDQECFCGVEKRSLNCDGSTLPLELGGPKEYECGGDCPRMLLCGSHPCPQKCHPGACPTCKNDPQVLKRCPCGRKEIPPGSRLKCTDPIPLCGNKCGKLLQCGPSDDRHHCESKCHEDECPPCEQVTKVRCRCGLIEKDVPCKDLSQTLCQKRCTKKRACGKHKCNQVCCIDTEHICPLPCNKSLNCGLHKCERLCHRGHCAPCLSASFEELHCECGRAVILPPVPCGTKPPECSEPCTRDHPCGHPPLHNCHSFPECPPCSVLTTKYCYGAHEVRKTVPCYMGEYSCGMPCGRPLECGHKCIRKCHDGACLEEGVSCTQPCTTPREGSCDHPCTAPCHPGKPCPPNTPCLAKLRVTCECGRRSLIRTCSENNSEYQRIATSLLASKIADVRLGKTVDTTDLSTIAKKMSLKTLECTEDCRKQERNLRLAISLQIANPDLSSKFSPRYSDSMKAWAKKDVRFCEMVHEKLTQLVQLAKQSKQKSRSYSFPSMNAVKRQFIHEYCEHFGVESVAYDPEPNRNIVATAYREKVWMPSYSLLEVVQRESGHRKVPSLLPSLKKDTTIKEPTRLVSVRTKLHPQPAVLAKHEPDLGESPP